MYPPVDLPRYILIVASAKIQVIGTRLFYSIAGNKGRVGWGSPLIETNDVNFSYGRNNGASRVPAIQGDRNPDK